MEHSPDKPNIRFVKDDEGNRQVQELTDDDVAAIPKQDIGVLVVGHIAPAKEELLAMLATSNFEGKILVVAWPSEAKMIGHEWLQSLEEQLKEMSKIPLIIEKLGDEVRDIFFEKPQKTYTKHTAHFIPKTQKSKATRKRFQRKR